MVVEVVAKGWWVALLAVALAVPGARAHWLSEAGAEPWSSPGTLRWLIDYSTMEPAHVRGMIDAGFNLIQGGGFRPEARELAGATPGVTTMQYICSRTIYHERLFLTNPELKNAAILAPDGSYKIIYGNPARYAGCYNRPEWLAYVKAAMDRLKSQGVTAIFFDNPMTWACYCPTCKELFRQYAKEHAGHEAELGASGTNTASLSGATELEDWFAIDTARRFFAEVHRHAAERGLRIVVNNLTYWLINQGVTDGVFTEGWGHAPFERDIAAYKIGLAASHGKPTGVLDYIPVKVRQSRGRTEFNASRGSGEKWVGAPVADEYELGYAQALACGGNYIANYCLELGRRIEQQTDLEDARIIAALTRLNRFQTAHPEAFVGARPGAEVALWYGLMEGPRRGEILGLNRGGVNHSLWAVINGGVPCEVVVDDDLTADRLAGLRALVVDGPSVIEPEQARGLAEFVTGGGTLVLCNALRVRGRFDPPAAARPISGWLPGLSDVAQLDLAWNELTMTGYAADRSFAKAVAEDARLTAKPDLPAGDYQVVVTYFDESDGRGSFELIVGGRVVASWQNDADDDKFHKFVSPPVTLKPGDEIAVVGHRHAGELARVSGLRITAAGGEGRARRTKVGRGEVLQVADSLAALPPAERAEVLEALRALSTVTPGDRPWPRTVLVNVTRVGERRCVHLVNYDFVYAERDKLTAVRATPAITLRVAGARAARWLTADAEPVALTVTDGRITVPPLRLYGVVEVDQ